MGTGVGAVMADQKKTVALDAALKGMFKALETRALPDRIRSVVDQLDEGVGATRRSKKRG